MTTELFIAPDTLQAFATQIFERAGIAPGEAADAANVLVWANRRGVDTHGVRNLKPLYIHRIRTGVIDTKAVCKIDYETPVSARVDAGGGLGLSAGVWGMRLAMAKAQASGIGLVTMRNSSHFGAAGHYPYLALGQDLIGIAMTGRFFAQGTEIGVIPTFAAKAMFSTNPISVSFPTAEETPFLLDMATSISPYNRVVMYRELGKSVPLGWGVDAEGRATIEPSALRQLFPLGGTREMGSHKGYGLSMMVEVLCAVLSGAWHDLATGDGDKNAVETNHDNSFDSHSQEGDAHFFGALRVDLFRPLSDFKRGMDAMIRALHAAPKEPGQDRIFVAGEIEHETEQTRLRDGIPLPPNVVENLRELAQQYQVPFEPSK